MTNKKIKEQMLKLREVQEKFGISKKTIFIYQNIYKRYLEYVDDEDAVYNEDKYTKFLFDVYKFDINGNVSRKNTRVDNLIRSKELLDDLESYNDKLSKTIPHNQKYLLTLEYQNLVNNYKDYCDKVRLNSKKTVKIKGDYVCNLLVYFINKGICDVKDISEKDINLFINLTNNNTDRSKQRYYYILRDFLIYLYSEDIVLYDYSYLVPTVRRINHKRVPTYIKEDKIKELLDTFPRERKIDKRNYAIILIASELGMRISDILNITFDDIDWENKTISFVQIKTNVKNILPLSNKLGWAIIDYIRNGRPITDSRYIFIRHNYPFEKLTEFEGFNKYFDKVGFDIYEETSKKGIHNLRHSLATRMLENDIPIHIISPTLGHSSIESTNVYLKIDAKRLKECGLDVKP